MNETLELEGLGPRFEDPRTHIARLEDVSVAKAMECRFVTDRDEIEPLYDLGTVSVNGWMKSLRYPMNRLAVIWMEYINREKNAGVGSWGIARLRQAMVRDIEGSKVGDVEYVEGTRDSLRDATGRCKASWIAFYPKWVREEIIRISEQDERVLMTDEEFDAHRCSVQKATRNRARREEREARRRRELSNRVLEYIRRRGTWCRIGSHDLRRMSDVLKRRNGPRPTPDELRKALDELESDCLIELVKPEGEKFRQARLVQ